MRLRIRAAWNALRGRPTVAFASLTLAEPLRLDSRTVVVGNHITAAPEARRTVTP